MLVVHVLQDQVAPCERGVLLALVTGGIESAGIGDDPGEQRGLRSRQHARAFGSMGVLWVRVAAGLLPPSAGFEVSYPCAQPK